MHLYWWWQEKICTSVVVLWITFWCRECRRTESRFFPIHCAWFARESSVLSNSALEVFHSGGSTFGQPLHGWMRSDLDRLVSVIMGKMRATLETERRRVWIHLWHGYPDCIPQWRLAPDPPIPPPPPSNHPHCFLSMTHTNICVQTARHSRPSVWTWRHKSTLPPPTLQAHS